ncbi:stimulated by retinoic acid gene 6 protein-like [Oculina patagonica]
MVGGLWYLRDRALEKRFLLFFLPDATEYWFNVTVKVLETVTPIYLVTFLVSAVFMVFQMYRFMLAFRNHVTKLNKNDRSFQPTELPSPDWLVGHSLRFCGYQIAYFLTGFLSLAFTCVFGVALVTALVLVMIHMEEVRNKVIDIATGILPPLGVTLVVWLFQIFLSIFVFKDRSLRSDKAMTIDNRQFYLLSSFFFFFFNILVGLFSCVSRILIGIGLGICFVGRTDRSTLMKGFHELDRGYMAYLGFLHVQVSHKHPVLRVFCHLLLHKARLKKWDDSTVNGTSVNEALELGLRTSSPQYPRVSAAAYHKWFVAMTIMRNPSLIPDRKRFFRKVILENGCVDVPTNRKLSDLSEVSRL